MLIPYIDGSQPRVAARLLFNLHTINVNKFYYAVKRLFSPFLLVKMAPGAGLAPALNRLTGGRATLTLPWNESDPQRATVHYRWSFTGGVEPSFCGSGRDGEFCNLGLPLPGRTLCFLSYIPEWRCLFRHFLQVVYRPALKLSESDSPHL